MLAIARRKRALVAATAALAVASALGTTRLHLDASVEALLPGKDPAVVSYRECSRRLGDISPLVVAIRSPDRKAALAYAAALAPRIRALGPTLVEHAVYELPELRRFVEAHPWLYADPGLLTELRDGLRRERLVRGNPLYLDLDDDPPSLDALSRRLAEHARTGGARFGGGTFAADDVVALVVTPPRTLVAAQGDEVRLVDAVKDIVDRFPPSRVAPNVQVDWSGEMAIAVAEHRAVVRDVAVTSVAVIVLVGLAVFVLFGRLSALPLVALPALFGALVTMGIAGAVLGTLNASSAFLAGIIVGNGINYPVLLLARYYEESARGVSVTHALVRSLRATARPTAVAALAAALAYGALAFTRFAGFRQFGLLGALGMVLCWLFTITLVPAVLLATDAGARAARKPPSLTLRYGRPFAAIAERASRLGIVLGGAIVVVAIAALPRWARSPLEYDFRNLRAVRPAGRDTSHQIDHIFGKALTPSVVLAPTRDAANAAARAIRAREAGTTPSPVAHAVTADDLLGGSPDELAHKLALLEEIRALLPPAAMSHLSPSARERFSELMPPVDARVPTLEDLPAIALRPFAEKDGTVGRVVLVWPPERGFSAWDGHDLIRLSDAIADVRMADGVVLHAAGRPMVFSAMVRSIADDAPLATVAALVAVALLTLAVVRRKVDALVILASLLLGVLAMLAWAAVAGLRLNFLNFVALPITFGIGVDYAANIVLRSRERPAPRIPDILEGTGSAVMLNSITTMIGYGSLLVAQNLALRSFGRLAIIGELACVLAALLFTPSLLALRNRTATVVAQPPPLPG